MPSFAANLSMMFTDRPFLERFDAAAAAGFTAVEFLFPYEYSIMQLQEKLTSNNLKLVLFNTTCGNSAAGEWGHAALPGYEKQARQEIDEAIRYAVELKCPQIHVMAGILPEGEDRSLYEQTFIDNLRYAADQCASHGIKVLTEALNPQTKPGYLFSSQYQTLDIINRTERANAFIQLDFFHAQIVDGNLSYLTQEFTGKYAHIQIASVPYRHEPDEGEINYPWLFELIDKSGYQGWIGCEYIPRTTTEAGLAWFENYRNK